jgi:hypothetical protein
MLLSSVPEYPFQAILLPDARVLVSGSDPQTPGLPEEMRIEVNTQQGYPSATDKQNHRRTILRTSHKA